MLSSPHTLAARQLRELRSDVRLVVVHPNYFAQHALMEFFGDAFLYVRFHGSILNSEELWAQFNTAAFEQSPAIDSSLVLDECDRAESREFMIFLQKLLGSRSMGRIYILTRHMPLALFTDPALRPLTELVPVREQTMLWNYAEREDNSSMLLEVYALGAGRVFVNGSMVRNWDGLLPRALFFYLIDRGMVTRQEIFQTFWPKLPVREATNVFHVTKRKINEVLQTDLTVYLSGYYHIAPNLQLSYDVSVFNTLIQDALVVQPPDAEDMLLQALSLYHGDFLSGMELEWVQPRRLGVRQSCCDALANLARLVQDRGDHRRALQLYLRAAALHRTRQDIIENVIRLYAGMDMKADALRCYENLKSELARAQAGELVPSLRAFAESLQV